MSEKGRIQKELLLEDQLQDKLCQNILSESQEHFRVIAEYSPNMIFINRGGSVVYVNDRCVQVMGYTKEEFYADDFDFLCLIAEGSKALIRSNMYRHSQGEDFPSYEYGLVTKDGKKIDALISTKLIKFKGEGSILGIVTDITDHKELERKLQIAQHELEERVKMRTQDLVTSNYALIKTQRELYDSKHLADMGKLAATVAHELRNPLGVIKVSAYNIRKKSETPLVDKHIDKIEKKVAESEQIINELLTYARIKMPNKTKVKVYDILEECVSAAGDRFKKENILFTNDFDFAKDMEIEADPLQMKEILSNIINNACQAFCGKDDRNVEVKASQHDDGSISIVVKDNGIGIPESDIQKVFEPFFTKKSGGTGLGLSICRELVELHRGEVRIESFVGVGTKVIVKLPPEIKERTEYGKEDPDN